MEYEQISITKNNIIIWDKSLAISIILQLIKEIPKNIEITKLDDGENNLINNILNKKNILSTTSNIIINNNGEEKAGT